MPPTLTMKRFRLAKGRSRFREVLLLSKYGNALIRLDWMTTFAQSNY